MENRIVSTKTYTVEVHKHEDGTESMRRTCEGFNPLELLGICEVISSEVRQHMKGIVNVGKTTRTTIERIVKVETE